MVCVVLVYEVCGLRDPTMANCPPTHGVTPSVALQEWFLERYHPTVIDQKKQDKLKWAAKEAAVFAQQLLANPTTAIASAALEPISEVRRDCDAE